MADSDSSSNGSIRTKRPRVVVKRACSSCRNRKAKCDGEEPSCGRCRKMGIEGSCNYDYNGDKRRQSTRALIENLTSHNRELKALIDDRSATSSTDNSGPVGTNSETIRVYDGKLFTADELGEVHFFGGTSNLFVIKNNNRRDSHSPSDLWDTNLIGAQRNRETSYHYNKDTVDCLLELYWKWQNSFIPVVDKDVFMEHMIKGGKYYSDLLLNAILSHGAPFSDFKHLKGKDGSSGSCYVDEIEKILLSELQKPNITTVQALVILASRDAAFSNSNSRGWVYNGMASRMAIDLGLHLNCQNLCDEGRISSEDLKIREKTFWACFLADNCWSAYVGRPPLLNESLVGIKPPSRLCFKANDSNQYKSVYARELYNQPQTLHQDSCFAESIVLCKILTRIMLSIYHSPGEISKGHASNLVIDLNNELESWEKTLPDGLKVIYHGINAPPVLLLNAFFHAIVIYVFRPFMGSHLNGLNPVEKCNSSANTIMEILAVYRRDYSLRHIMNLASHFIFTAVSVQMSLGKDDENYDSETLELALAFLDEISQTWPSAARIGLGIRRTMDNASDTTFIPENDDGLPEMESSNFWLEYFRHFNLTNGF